MNDLITVTYRNRRYKRPIDIPRKKKNVSEKLIEHFVVTDISFHIVVLIITKVEDNEMKDLGKHFPTADPCWTRTTVSKPLA